MYYFYRKSNRGHGICLLYRGCPPFGESIIRGFTVLVISDLHETQGEVVNSSKKDAHSVFYRSKLALFLFGN